ncbi:MAG TPA: ribonuclease T2 [Solimonas sp.]
MIRRSLWAFALSAFCVAAQGRDRPGEFDYWLLALSWSPQYCANQGADPQCVYPHNFVVHGLWPQYERGFPDFCQRTDPVPRDLVTRLLPLMPSENLIQHQWRKHGSCSGLDVKEYALQVERARRSIVVPPAYSNPETHLRTSVREIEATFIAENPQLSAESLAVQCSGRWLREVRVCLDIEFQPRACGRDVDDRCGADVMMRPNRKPRAAP